METVDIGHTRIRIPVAAIHGKATGPTLLVTAGIDGDEYAGIEAAYRLIHEFSEKPFLGKLIIIPIVNVPGFIAETSQNPLDGLFPKYIYPGKKDGKPTQRLCWYIHNLAEKSDYWLDMHGGALTEIIEPFIGSWVSGNSRVDSMTQKIIQSLDSKFAVFENNPAVTKTALLAKRGCGYLLTESGESGGIEEKAVTQHICWAHQTMSALGMLTEKVHIFPKTIMTRLDEYVIHRDGIWKAARRHCEELKTGAIIGEVLSLNGRSLETITAKEEGKLLWVKVGYSARRGDVVAGVGIN